MEYRLLIDLEVVEVMQRLSKVTRFRSRLRKRNAPLQGATRRVRDWRSAVEFCYFSLALAVITATAQPVPKINSVSPEWLQRGTAADVTFSGENLGSVTNFIISGDPGLTATISPSPDPTVRIESSPGGISAVAARDDKRLRAKVTIAPDAALSQREVRLVTATGVSNPVPLNIGHVPEVAEKGPNQTVELAQRLDLPAAVTGRINAAAEIDYFRIAGKKGEVVVLDVFASRLGSPMDPSLAVMNASGQELARSEDVNGLDPLLAFKVPEDGEYIVQVRDFRYQGGEKFQYRLLAGAMPYVYSVFPFGARRGQNVDVEVRGHNFASPKLTLRIEPNAPIGRQDIRTATPLGISNPFPFDVTDLPEFLEKEPNTALDQANEVALPVVINGRIQAEKDSDAFKFKVQKDQPFIFEVMASRFGSPLDALLTLKDKKGNVIQRNDDAIGADARIEHKFTETGEYVVVVQDLLGRGGDNFGYRFSIRPPQPDFMVRFLPDNPRLSRGGHAPLRCELTRLNGFNETVRVAFVELPPGVFSEPVLLIPPAASALISLASAEDCPLGTFPIKMAATSVLNGKPVTRPVEALSNDKPAKEAFLTVLDRPPFTLEIATLSASLEQGQSAAIEVIAQRRDGFTGEIKLSAEGFSTGREPISQSLEIQQASLKGNDSRALLNLKAKFDSEIGTRPILVKGDTSLDGQTLTQYSSALPVTISQVPFVLSTTLKRLSVTALPSASPSAAREAVFSVKADRRQGFTNEIELTLEGVPDGVAATIDKIPANTSEAAVKLVASENAPVGKEFSLKLLGIGQFNDRNYKHRPGEIKLTINAAGETADAATEGSK